MRARGVQATRSSRTEPRVSRKHILEQCTPQLASSPRSFAHFTRGAVAKAEFIEIGRSKTARRMLVAVYAIFSGLQAR